MSRVQRASDCRCACGLYAGCRKTGTLVRWSDISRGSVATRLKCDGIVRRDDVIANLLPVKAKFHYASWFEADSKLVGDQLRTSFEPASVMEFGFNQSALAKSRGRRVPELAPCWTQDGPIFFRSTLCIESSATGATVWLTCPVDVRC